MDHPDVDSRPHFDHLIVPVPDPGPVCLALAYDWGLYVHSEGSTFENGFANLVVPLEPPEYIEILYIQDADAFAGPLDLLQQCRRCGSTNGTERATFRRIIHRS